MTKCICGEINIQSFLKIRIQKDDSDNREEAFTGKNKYKAERKEKCNSVSFALRIYETERSIEIVVQCREYVEVKVKFNVMLRRTVSRPFVLEQSTHLGLTYLGS